MRSSFIFCLLAMYFIASANARSCWNIVPCRVLCPDSNWGQVFTTESPGTPCTMSGIKDGVCESGECKKKRKVNLQ
uniref:Putative salivary kunitz domain protein n=1 Tax=Ixodes ricinus TaxID=34613 RepID=A0A0K8R6F2_IXORI